MPPALKYFYDPMATIKNYTSNKLHANHSGVSGYGLATIYCHVTGKDELVGAHNSKVDCLAQKTICDHDEMAKYFDKPNSGVQLMKDVFTKKFAKRTATLAEKTREVPPGYTEDDTVNHEDPAAAKWDSADPPQRVGPTDKARSATTLLSLFFCLFPKRVEKGNGDLDTSKFSLDGVAAQSNAYGNEDPVKEYVHPDRKKGSFKPCNVDDPDKRTRYGGKTAKDRKAPKRSWIPFTISSILVFLGILIGMSALGTRNMDQVWSDKYATAVPWMQNAMHSDAFSQHIRYMHFVDNTKAAKKGEHGWSPTFKVDPVLDHFTTLFKQLWTLGQKFCIDESMIKYNGRAISWVQYMPAKPIKHGIKAYVLCCSVTAFMFSFEIMTGASELIDGSRVGIVSRLMEGGGFEGDPGRVLYTDNYYTSMELMSYLYMTFGIFLVGTMRLSKKKAKTAVDFAYHKLSTAALKLLPKGWMRRATRLWPKATAFPAAMWYQCVTWKDRAQVALLTNFGVRPRVQTDTVRRRSRGHGVQEIDSHPVILDYQHHMGGVDQFDRSLADWGMTRR